MGVYVYRVGTTTRKKFEGRWVYPARVACTLPYHCRASEIDQTLRLSGCKRAMTYWDRLTATDRTNVLIEVGDGGDIVEMPTGRGYFFEHEFETAPVVWKEPQLDLGTPFRKVLT